MIKDGEDNFVVKSRKMPAIPATFSSGGLVAATVLPLMTSTTPADPRRTAGAALTSAPVRLPPPALVSIRRKAAQY